MGRLHTTRVQVPKSFSALPSFPVCQCCRANFSLKCMDLGELLLKRREQVLPEMVKSYGLKLI